MFVAETWHISVDGCLPTNHVILTLWEVLDLYQVPDEFCKEATVCWLADNGEGVKGVRQNGE